MILTSLSSSRALHPGRHQRFLQRLACLVVRFLAPGVGWKGQDYVPAGGGCLLVANHISHADAVLVLCAVRRRLHFMAMSELFDIPVVGAIIRACGGFPVRRGTADRGALEHAAALLQAGECVVVFPEGCHSRSGEMGPFLPGAALLALRSAVPVIPVGIAGAQALMPYGARLARPTQQPIEIVFGPPVRLAEVAEHSTRASRTAATQALRDAVGACAAAARTRRAQRGRQFAISRHGSRSTTPTKLAGRRRGALQ